LGVALWAKEASCGARRLARMFVSQGCEVPPNSPDYVLPYAKAQTHDERDAEAGAEGASEVSAAMIPIARGARLIRRRAHRSGFSKWAHDGEAASSVGRPAISGRGRLERAHARRRMRDGSDRRAHASRDLRLGGVGTADENGITVPN
jgi:hypothetical protein